MTPCREGKKQGDDETEGRWMETERTEIIGRGNQAPDALLVLGEPLGISAEATAYKRRIGDWLLWRAGPARGPARYLAIHSADLDRQLVFTLEADGAHHGTGPSGVEHTRFRAWKEDLLGR